MPSYLDTRLHLVYNKGSYKADEPSSRRTRMAALYGRMKDQVTSGRREVTRMAHQEIASTLETWDGAVKTELERDGSFRVYIGSKYNPDTLIAKGNINDGKREVMCPDYRGSTEGTHESISTLYEFTRHDMASPLGL